MVVAGHVYDMGVGSTEQKCVFMDRVMARVNIKDWCPCPPASHAFYVYSIFHS